MKKSIIGKRVKVHNYQGDVQPIDNSPVGNQSVIVEYHPDSNLIRVLCMYNTVCNLFYPEELRYLNNKPVVV